jgi:GntP family gluconate:H+ symporter
VANNFIGLFGKRHLHWALAIVAFIVGLPVFFAVGLVLLIPIVFTLARDTKIPLLSLGLPLVMGLSASHGFVPPHPGPLVAIKSLGADMGKTILYSLLIGFPTALVVGPLLGSWLAKRTTAELGGIGSTLVQQSARKCLPGFGLTLFTILLPVLLMLLPVALVMVGSFTGLPVAEGNRVYGWLEFIGTPLISMLIAVLFSFYSFGKACGLDRKQILKFTEECVGPAASIMLVVGAGGGFSKVLVYGGVDGAIAELAKGLQFSPLVLGWLVAALIRLAVGSATVAITLAASIMAPIVAATPEVNRELLVLALGAGSVIASHVNDGGFWFVKEYLNMSVPQTLKTWTVLETVMAVVALLFVLVINALV